MASVLVRLALIAGCVLVVWRSVRIAVADRIASAGTAEALERALRYAPNDERLLAREAIARSDGGDSSPEVDRQLRRAEEMNPLDSAVRMTIGLREEFLGNRAKAEQELVRATEVDAQFKPAWTLANYYERTGQVEKSWPMIERILNLEPLGYDPAPVFEMCWRAADGDAERILNLIPKEGHRPVQYLAFLMATKRTDAALEAWPTALKAANAADSGDTTTLKGFVDYLTAADRTAEAVLAWNELVDRGMVRSGKVEPAKGESIADPEFQFPTTRDGFGWRVDEISGVNIDNATGLLELEVSGDEPESFGAFWTWAPVVSGKRYRLTWKSDGGMLSMPDDPGFSFRIVHETHCTRATEAGACAAGNAVTQCPPILAAGNSAGCEFTAAEDGKEIGRARIEFGYARAQGTTRPSGTLQISEVRLGFAK